MVFTHKYGAFLSSNPVIMEVHPTKQHPEHGRESLHNHAALQDIQKQSSRQSVLPATVLGQVSNEYGNFAAVTHKNSRNPCWKRVWLGLHQLACSSCFANFLCSCCTRVCLGACIAFRRWGTQGDTCHFNKYSLDPWNPKDLNHACQLPTESWSNLGKIDASPQGLIKSWYKPAYLMNLKFEAIHYSVNSKVKLIRFSHQFAVRIIHKNPVPELNWRFLWEKNTVRNHQQTMELISNGMMDLRLERFQQILLSFFLLPLAAPAELTGCARVTQGHLVIPTGFQKKTGYPLVNIQKTMENHHV